MYTMDQSRDVTLNQSSRWAEMAAHDALKIPDFRDPSALSTFGDSVCKNASSPSVFALVMRTVCCVLEAVLATPVLI